jgi:hypothetical protein
MEFNEQLIALHRAIEEGVELVNTLIKSIGGFLQEVEQIQDKVCGKELCSANCDNDEHCHNEAHILKSGNNKFCCEPVEEESVEDERPEILLEKIVKKAKAQRTKKIIS